MNNGEIYQFEPFRVDPAKRELWCDGKLVPLQPKAFDCLVYLLEHRDRVVGHDELIATVWGKVEIGDSVLGQIISRIRGVLGDNANRQTTIRTITRVGYSWVMPVRVLATENEGALPDDLAEAGIGDDAGSGDGFAETAEATPPSVAATPPPVRRRHLLARGIGVLLLVLVALAGLRATMSPAPRTVSASRADTAVVLPVRTPQEPGNAWIRLGVMDLIGERLRAAGQTVVPSDNVVALARRLPAEPATKDIEALATAAAANLVLRASAEPHGDGWRVELATAHGRGHALVAHGDGADVIEAARIATDRMAILLGLDVAPPDGNSRSEPLDYVLQQVKAATLVDRLDEARTLLEASGEPDDPRVAFQQGDVELRAGNYVLSQRIFQGLLDRVPAERDAILRASVLHGLAYSLIRQIQLQQARPYVDEAISLLETREPFRNAHDALGFAVSARAFLRRVVERDYKGAETDYSRARVLFESSGDQLALARLDANLSMLMGDANRVAEALSLGKTALEQLALFGDVQSQLRLRITLADLNSDQLDTALAIDEARQLEPLIAQADNPSLIELARITQVVMFADGGLSVEAGGLLRELLEHPTAPAGANTQKGVWPEYVAAWLAWSAGDAERATRIASDALARHGGESPGSPWNIARTWRTLQVAQLALGRTEAASATLAAALEWAGPYRNEPRVGHWITLARAEAAAARGDADEATREYEAAWSLALADAPPRQRLEVAQSYCGFLFAGGRAQEATRIAGHVSRWASGNYDAALLQTRLHHALGQTSAWHRAVERARQLAGERVLPAELLVPPQPR